MSTKQPKRPTREPNPTSHPEPAGPVPPPNPTRTPTKVESPWMTTRQVADYAGRHRDTVLLALRRKELKGAQREGRANATWRVHRDDVDRWMRGERPARGNPRLRSA